MTYSTIVADPPWPYQSPGPRSSSKHRPNSWDSPNAGVGSVKRYGCMSIAELSALQIPVADNAHLYLWTTNAFMVEAHDVARAWGFEPKTVITWVKVKPSGDPSMKTGYYYRGCTEHILFCVRGKLRLSGTPAPTAILSGRLPHSVKPDCFYEMVEQQSPAPRLEMFARQHRPGWDCWGNEVESNVCIEAA